MPIEPGHAKISTVKKLAPPLAVLLAGLALALALPLIDRAVPLTDLTRAGDRLDLGGGLLVTPPAGWQLERGVRAGAATVAPLRIGTASAQLSRDGARIVVHLATFPGDAAALLDQIDQDERAASSLPGYTVAGRRERIVTTGGQTGITESFTSDAAEGMLGAYAWPSTHLGLLIAVRTPAGQLSAHTDDYTAMFNSVTVAHK